MIASVHGRVAVLGLDTAIIEVGGVGLQVHCTPATLAELRTGETVRLATSLVVREDALTLYGFADADESEMFTLLQTASGVGPRLAQAVLAVHRPNAVRRAVASEDLGALMLVPGIGKKGAQRLVLELKDRLGAPEASGVSTGGQVAAGWHAQLHGALTGLGYSAREADDAVIALAGRDGAAPDGAAFDGGQPDIAGLLRSALQVLGRNR